jgi:chromosome segregation ATPase
MSVNAKHIATFILGAAAGLAAAKYMSMSDEEKDKLAGDLKDKANKFKDEAEAAFNKAKDYFEELKAKGADAFKEHFADAEKMMGDLFAKKTPTGEGESQPG